MNWPVIIIVGIILIVLIIFLVRRNQKDEKDMENWLKNDQGEPNKDSSADEQEESVK